jgi:beta-phosphoglucomutase
MPELLAVIFDMDGVLIDSEPVARRMISVLISEAGLSLTPDEYEQCKGMTGKEFWTLLIDRYDLPESVEFYREKMKAESSMYGPELAAVGVRDLLELLHESDILLAVGTSSSRPRMEIVLNTLDIGGYFGATVSGDDITQSKPSPAVFLQAAELLGCKSEHCLVIEDSTRGIIAAKAAGMTAVGYTGLGATAESLSDADVVLESFIGVTAASLRDNHRSVRLTPPP